MNRVIILFVVGVLSAFSVFGADVTAEPDTVLSVTDSRSVVITESPSGLTVKVRGSADDPEFVSVYNQAYGDSSVVKSHRKELDIPVGLEWVGASWTGRTWSCISGGIGIGFVDAVTKSGAGLPSQMGKSFEIQWLYVIGVKYRFCKNSSLTLGVGVDWRNFRTSLSDEAFRPVTPDGGAISVQPYPDGVIAKGSRVKVFSVMFPLMYQQSLPVRVPGNGRLGFFAGPVASLNTHASVRTKWIGAGGNNMDECCSNIGQRFFTVDFMAGIRFCGFANVYFRYSPQTVLKGDSPQFRSLSTGIMLSF